MIYKPFFLMAFLVFGLIGNPSAFLNFDNKIQHDSVKLDFTSSSLAGLAFAQNGDNNADEDKAKNEDQTQDESENEDQAKDKEKQDKEKEEKIEIEVEIENGVAKIKTQVNDEKTEFEINETDKDVIIKEIALRTGLTIEEVKSVITFEEAEDSEETETEDGDVNNEGNQTDNEDNQANNQDEGNVNNEDDGARESKAKQIADDRIAELEQKIAQLEQRLQTLMEKLDSGEYFGPVVGAEPLPKSYSISFDGSASSLNDSETAAVSGEIFMEPLGSIKDTAKFRVNGGQILVGDTSYDFVFGKARMTSSDQSGNNDSITIIGQIISDNGDVKTVRILLGSATPLEGDFGLEPINVEMMPQSTISREWSVSAQGQLSQIES